MVDNTAIVDQSHSARANDKQTQTFKELAFYLVCVAVGGGILLLLGVSLLDMIVAWLIGSLVCVVWAIDRTYSDFRKVCLNEEHLADCKLEPYFEYPRHD